MYDLPGRSDIARCVITREVVLEKVNPTLVSRTEEKPERLRRAAS
jgi:ATP-dependent Clp protease ATP-binding subunit ClpX